MATTALEVREGKVLGKVKGRPKSPLVALRFDGGLDGT